MERYLHKYTSQADFNADYAFNKENYNEPWVSHTDGKGVDYDLPYEKQPLTYEMLSAGTIYWKTFSESYTKTIQYSINGGDWISITSSTGGTTFSVSAGDKIRFKGNNASYASTGAAFHNLLPSNKFIIYGNIMSLIGGDDFIGLTTLTEPNTFMNFFYRHIGAYSVTDDTALISAKNLILPATDLTEHCYYCMFERCTSLTIAPALPATTLANSCYVQMFYGCTSLTTAPALPATTLASACYSNMFQGCTSLTTAPALPATTLASACYSNMFQGCTSLATAPALPATTLANYCYQNMFDGCTSLTTAPALPATNLASTCYYQMFKGCASLSYIKCNATTTESYNVNDWVTNVSPTGTFVKNPLCETWTTGNSGIPTGWEVANDINKEELSEMPLTFGIISAGTIVWETSNTALTRTIQYSKNGGAWTDLTSTTAGTSISVSVGDIISFRGDNTAYATSTSNYSTFSASTAYFNAAGNIMSLISSTGYTELSAFTTGNTFLYLFRDTKIVNAEGLYLPATTLANYCYGFMFYNCTSLTAAPELPATTLASFCYSTMFYNCTGLTSAPVLPVTTLASDCYSYMFRGCKSLTTAPELPATTLAEGCYCYMFNGCTSLTTAPELPATTLANECYLGMFRECTSLTTAHELPATILASNCCHQMFYGCTGLTAAPELPATTLAEGCYDSMFYGCTSLTTAPELPAATLAQYCYEFMFAGCTSLTTAPELPATKLANYCYMNMFDGCTNLTTAPELPATALTNYCYAYMFFGCTSLTTAPSLLATTLANYCYSHMFFGCTNLNFIECYATDISATYCLTNWVYGVSPTGRFMRAEYMLSWPTGNHGIPTGWENICDFKKEPLTFKIVSAGTIVWKKSSSSINRSIRYRTNNSSSWTYIAATTAGNPITVAAGDIVQFIGSNNSYTETNGAYNCSFGGSTAKYELEGNIMSLISEYGFATVNSFSSAHTFERLFFGCTTMLSAKNLVMPVKSLMNYCYFQMFENCSSLDTAPALPATTLANNCYNYIFQGCTSLTAAPELPATTLADMCYRCMFSACTSLTTAPELPATTLTSACYQNMFNGCTSLNYIKCLATDVSASNCLNNWVEGVASTGTFVKASSMSSWPTGTSGIPDGWTTTNA